MSIEQEAALLEKHREKAEKGHMLDVQEFKQEYEWEVGHRIGSGQIYRVLNRHGWRKIMPRSKHPKRASEEEIASSKKQHSNQGDAKSFPQARQSTFNVPG